MVQYKCNGLEKLIHLCLKAIWEALIRENYERNGKMKMIISIKWKA